ncbi:AraC family transcriptional regulator [Niabella ginsenosidivorans]|uniref:AraC family transcriptional regulator n=2 Tax=Niabella ginsenosidivorans TaxID=1176587 RepID=A0A1A9I503_9BACT|nr:AraC family transcriptional regulator [Niabella ginsenosidivorans]
MDADIHLLYGSGFYRILNFKCRCRDCCTSGPEYSKSFSISFVRKGNFIFNVFRHALDSYTGCVLVTKPGYERTVTHAHSIPDECTILDFKNDFYAALKQQYAGVKFFTDEDLHSTLIKTTAETEWLHFSLLQHIQHQTESRLYMDTIVMQIIRRVLEHLTVYKPDERVHAQLKKNHLTTIERAKEYMMQQFTSDISLTDLSKHCHISPFHFSRIFSTFTRTSPHRFLLGLRLKHAEMLLQHTRLPVGDIGFSSGFNSIEHFSAAFKSRYTCSPAKFRELHQGHLLIKDHYPE